MVVLQAISGIDSEWLPLWIGVIFPRPFWGINEVLASLFSSYVCLLGVNRSLTVRVPSSFLVAAALAWRLPDRKVQCHVNPRSEATAAARLRLKLEIEFVYFSKDLLVIFLLYRLSCHWKYFNINPGPYSQKVSCPRLRVGPLLSHLSCVRRTLSWATCLWPLASHWSVPSSSSTLCLPLSTAPTTS